MVQNNVADYISDLYNVDKTENYLQFFLYI